MICTKPFERVYSHYPLKKGKFQAQKTWTKLNDSGDLPDGQVLIKAIKDQKTERAFLKRQNRFCPSWKHFSTWLNARCWSDECELPLGVTKAAHNTPGNGVDNMVRALNILNNLGRDRFDEFCRAVEMPVQDIEAVRFKHSGEYSIESLTRGIGR